MKKPLLDYSIIVPSYKRPEAMTTLKDILPDFTLTVNPEEYDLYLQKKPRGSDNITIKALEGKITNVSDARKASLEGSETRYVVLLDDDITKVIALPGQKARTYEDPDSIKQIFENGVQILMDLGLSIYSWSQSPNQAYFNGNNFISFSQTAGRAWIIDTSREFHWHPELMVGEDTDVSMQALQRERIIFFDNRFHVDCGVDMDKPGGCQASRTKEGVDAAFRILKAKWGSAGAREKIDKEGNIAYLYYNVTRRSILASEK